MTMQTMPSTKNNFAMNFTQVVYSTLAKAKPPMMAPQEGFSRFTSPLPAENVMTMASTEKFRW